MLSPENNIGKICRSLEKFFDTRAGKIKVKMRPVLIIGCEDDYDSPMNVDYELLTFSRMLKRKPNPNYDIFIDNETYRMLGLKSTCYLRTHKISWNHVRHMDIQKPIFDLKSENTDLFIKALTLNHQWIETRNDNFKPFTINK